MSSAIGLGWTLARKQYDAKDEIETENTRVSAYESYLNKNERLLSDRHAESREKLLKQYPSSEDIVYMFAGNHLNEFLWNRNVRFQDFTSIRLGTGRMEIPGKIQIPKERFSVYNDELAERPAALKESYHIIKQVPSLVCLRENKIIGLIGDKDRIDAIANNIAVQLSALHSYTDVRMVFIYDKKEETQYSWARWLPHVFSPDKKVRLHGNDEDSAHHTLSYLTEIIKSRTEAAESHDSEHKIQLPYYIVFCTQPELLYNHAIYRYMTDSTDCGFTFILVYPRMEQLPNECRFLIQDDDTYTGYYSIDQTRDETNIVNFDYFSSEKAEQIARQMIRYWVNEIADGEIPERIDFLEMYGISDVHEWDLLRHWKENRTYENIRAQIGVTYGNKPVYLDIHEKYHGPHGLVAGTTGSGKSETIQTFILSLMLNYHPDEVAFVLIDYKGGGMANLFAGTPHLAGTITNISASGEQSVEGGGDTYQTGRALLSLKSEIKRRQKIFNDYSVNHIDAYNRLYREKEAEEPLPHLILISDEFAELKKEQPEFMKELVSTARVGRSLGIHLILATQKPAGVVDDEIWSNARFKLCLKVQDRSDSMGMLKRPEAAELTRTGQGYLQIGNDEIFEMFQSGYSGAAYQPEVNMAEVANSTVEVLSRDGIRTRKRSAVKKGGKKVSQLETCVQYIGEISAKNGIAPVKKLWLPMFDGNLPLETLFTEEMLHNTCTAIIGKLDYPEQQSQPLFTLKYPQCGHVMIAGNSGSGKSTLMKTILYSLMCGQTAEYINWYALDFSNRMFDDLQSYEHCGGIVYGEDEDKVKRVFRLLTETLQYRKNKLADAGVSSVEEYRKKSANPMPYILVLIDNYAGFKEAYESYTDTMITLLREGVSRGIHFIVTLNALSDIPTKCRQYFSTRLPLVLNERMDYHDYLYCTPTVPVLPYPGSGLIQYNESIVQFQTAYISEPEKYALRVRKSADGYHAKILRFIDKKQEYSAFAASISESEELVPLGWYLGDIEPYSISLGDTFCYFISDTDGEGAQSMLKNILLYAKTHSLETHLIGDVHGQEEYGQSMAKYREYTDVLAFMNSLGTVFKERSTARKAYIAEYGNTGLNEYMRKTFQPILIVFGDYNEFCDMTYGNSTAGEMRYDTFFETILKQGKNFGITMIAHWTPQINTVNYLKSASQLFTSYKTGIHLGGKLSTQKLISANASPYSVKASAPEVGYALEGNRIAEVYIPPHTVKEEF
ncbi:MAG: type VII secretion protein EssC [Clostridia bacterium]|nr:type VII secretion protein EssC [Clostridia bacterium]